MTYFIKSLQKVGIEGKYFSIIKACEPLGTQLTSYSMVKS